MLGQAYMASGRNTAWSWHHHFPTQGIANTLGGTMGKHADNSCDVMWFPISSTHLQSRCETTSKFQHSHGIPRRCRRCEQRRPRIHCLGWPRPCKLGTWCDIGGWFTEIGSCYCDRVRGELLPNYKINRQDRIQREILNNAERDLFRLLDLPIASPPIEEYIFCHFKFTGIFLWMIIFGHFPVLDSLNAFSYLRIHTLFEFLSGTSPKHLEAKGELLSYEFQWCCHMKFYIMSLPQGRSWFPEKILNIFGIIGKPTSPFI